MIPKRDGRVEVVWSVVVDTDENVLDLVNTDGDVVCSKTISRVGARRLSNYAFEHGATSVVFDLDLKLIDE